jgi:hypothetical protein
MNLAIALAYEAGVGRAWAWSASPALLACTVRRRINARTCQVTEKGTSAPYYYDITP